MLLYNPLRQYATNVLIRQEAVGHRTIIEYLPNAKELRQIATLPYSELKVFASLLLYLAQLQTRRPLDQGRFSCSGGSPLQLAGPG